MTEQNRTITDLAKQVDGRVEGDGNRLIQRQASLESAKEGAISFLDDLKSLDDARKSQASCIIVPNDAPEIPGKSIIRVARPKLAFALIAELLYPSKRTTASVHPTAEVATSATISKNVIIGAHVCVGERARIGAGTQLHHGAIIGSDVTVGSDCIIHPNVVLYDGAVLGDRVILHATVVVGADGFGYVPDEKNILHKFPQVGTVVIEDDVEIGPGTCIDRGSLGETRIGCGTKIDNLVQIAHNVQIGERVVIAAQTGISGSTIIEDDVVIGGQVGLGDHAHVMSGAIIGSKAGILPGKIVRKGVWWGIPVQPLKDYKRLNAHINRIPQVREEVKELQRLLKELEEKKTDGK